MREETFEPFYFLATAPMQGPLALFQIHGQEENLADGLDRFVTSRTASAPGNPLHVNELRYGWLRDASGGEVDEVLVAKPVSRVRVLMTHGGEAVRQAVGMYLDAAGFRRIAEEDDPRLRTAAQIDPLIDPLLAACATQTQAAAVLDWKKRHENNPGDADFPAAILAHHTLIVCGPPNVGKSSLLNNLAGYDRAFVHNEAGSTLDVVGETVELGGYAVMVRDLPGYLDVRGELEEAAWKKAEERLAFAEAALFVCDASAGWDGATAAAATKIASLLRKTRTRLLVVRNKSDLPSRLEGRPWEAVFPGVRHVGVCSLPDGDAKAVLDGEAYSLFS